MIASIIVIVLLSILSISLLSTTILVFMVVFKNIEYKLLHESESNETKDKT